MISSTSDILTERWTQLRPHPMQSKLWRTRERNVKVCAGRGSGKTEIARRRVVRYLRVKKPWRDPRYFYALPTYNQCYRVARSHILSLIPRSWFVKVPGDSQMEFKFVFGSWLFLVGLDKPERVEGDQYDGGVVDECSDQKPGVYARTLRPAFTHRSGWLWRIGVPKRFGKGASEFRVAFDNGALGRDSFWWPSWDILSPQEIAELQSELDEKDYNEQIGGRWEDAGGAAYYAYSDSQIDGNVSASAVYNPDREIFVGTDFNVDPMAWCLGQRVVKGGVEYLHIFDEVWKRGTNTPAQLDTLHARYPNHRAGWTFTGDASSRKRQTSASRTDYSHILNDERFKANVVTNKKNPAVKDRLASVNALCQTKVGLRRLLINPQCTHLRNDLKTRSLNEYGEPVPAESGQAHDSGHMTDALGYLINKYYPITLSTLRGRELVVVGNMDDDDEEDDYGQEED
jgi:hypothetical protein